MGSPSLYPCFSLPRASKSTHHLLSVSSATGPSNQRIKSPTGSVESILPTSASVRVSSRNIPISFSDYCLQIVSYGYFEWMLHRHDLPSIHPFRASFSDGQLRPDRSVSTSEACRNAFSSLRPEVDRYEGQCVLPLFFKHLHPEYEARPPCHYAYRPLASTFLSDLFGTSMPISPAGAANIPYQLAASCVTSGPRA